MVDCSKHGFLSEVEPSQDRQTSTLSQYDTIRYSSGKRQLVLWHKQNRALKSWRDGQLNLAHGTETKNDKKNQNQKPSSSEETVQAKVRGGSTEEEVKLRGVGFVKEVGLSMEWKRDGVIDVQSGEDWDVSRQDIVSTLI